MGRNAIPPFHERLLAWWDQNGRKDLPWQNPREPYRVWISEIMLQQTQVSTVIPYFVRWMEAFPDIQTLATASLDEVLAHWAGLGYYARARNLHKTARQCLELHGSELPVDAADLARLPGIGTSTANAIVSQSSNRPAAVLDGNVRRLLARHAAVAGYTGSTAAQRRLWAEAEARLPANRGADYTQAVMDLGALVCTRSNPDCTRCPVGADCRALLLDRVSEFPSPKPRPRVGRRRICMLILLDGRGRVLLEKRPPSGIWGGLWCLPEGEDTDAIGEALGIEVEDATALPSIEHRLSHVQLEISPFLATAGDARSVKCFPGKNWFDRDGQSGLGLPKPVAALLKQLNNGAFE